MPGGYRPLKQFTALSAFLTAAYLRLPGQMRGMLLLFCATILFSVMHALIRHVGEGQHPFEMAFFRNLFGFIVLAPFFLRYGFGILRTQRLGLHALRGSIHVGSMMLFFSAVTIAPLATVAAMTFTAPLFVTLGAVFLLGEQIRYRRMGALFLGFAGVMIVLRPGFGELEVGALMALEQGETLSRLLKASLKPPMQKEMATRLWQDALSQLEVTRLEAALHEMEQAGIPDTAQWQELHRALAEARQHARQPFN